MKQYPKYKDSEIDWIGEIPKNWKITKLKRYCNRITDGSHISPQITDEGYPYITVRDMGDLEIEFTNCKKISSEDYLSLKKDGCQPKLNDVLLSKDGTIGKAVVIKEKKEFVILSSIGLITPNLDCFDSDYLRYYLISGINLQQMFSFIHGSALTRLTIELIKNLIVIIPSIQEQKQIARYLDKQTHQIDSLIDKRKKMVELLQEERIVIINDAVTKGINPKAKMKDSGVEWIGETPEHWEIKKLKYVASLREEVNENSDFRIALENIESGTGKLIDLDKKINYEGMLSAFKKWDTIFNKLRPYLHKVYFAERDGGALGELLIIYSKGELLSKFLFYKLFSKSIVDIIDGSTQGTKMPRANWGDFICQLPIVFPPQKIEQSEIINHIETETSKIDRTLSQFEQEIVLLLEYKTALISEAVTGKIDVRGEVLYA